MKLQLTNNPDREKTNKQTNPPLQTHEKKKVQNQLLFLTVEELFPFSKNLASTYSILRGFEAKVIIG